MMQSYHRRVPQTITFAQERALTKINAFATIDYFLTNFFLTLLRVSGVNPMYEAIMCWGTR